MKKKPDSWDHKKFKVEMLLRNGTTIEIIPGSRTHPYWLFWDLVKAIEKSGLFHRYYKNEDSIIRLKDVSFVSIKRRKE